MSPSKSVEIAIAGSVIRIRDAVAFGEGGEEPCRRFLSRIFTIEAVLSVRVDRDLRTASIRHNLTLDKLASLLIQMASAIRVEPVGPGVRLPSQLPISSVFSIHRLDANLTTFQVIDNDPGRLRLRHESLRNNLLLSDRIERELVAVSGVRLVKVVARTGHLLIRYDPATITALWLVSWLEASLFRPDPQASKIPAVAERFGMANLSLVVAAVGEHLLPPLLPISAVLLVGTNIQTFQAARAQLERRRLGLPVLYLAIVATTLLTGQFLASALMTWFFQFWHRRFRVELAAERSRLLEETSLEPTLVRLLKSSGVEVLVERGKLQAGDRIVVAVGDLVQADGRIIDGEGIVDERGVRGLEGFSRRGVGETLLAGSTIIAGVFQVEVARVGDQTRAAAIRRALIAATTPSPGSTALTTRSEAFATRAVGPTLATAGVGFLAGDLLAVAAILRPDYATGPGLAVPLETLHDVARCARAGIVARDPEALERLAQVDLFVLDDHAMLSKTELDLKSVETTIPEMILLRYAASIFRHLIDDRALALVAACRTRQIHLLNLEPVDFYRGVTVILEKHRIRVGDRDPGAGRTGSLVVEIDGTIVGLIEFKTTTRREAAAAIDRIRQVSHVPFALVSPRSEAEVAELARSLGVEMYRGDFQTNDTSAFLTACRDRGLKTGFVGDCRAFPKAAAEAFVAISITEDDGDLDLDPAGLVIQQARLARLADLHRISRSHATRISEAQQWILIPNLLCVAGAFFFGFTGMTAVMLSNLGTLSLYRRASDSLRGMDTIGPLRTDQPRRAG